MQASLYEFVIDSPLGRLGLCTRGEALARLDYLPAASRIRPPATRFGRRVRDALAAWFDHPALPLSLATVPAGTAFQQRVWQALVHIPPGSVLTYGELADRLGSGPRAVGNACRANPVSIVIPCHRVVGASGLGGYSGRTGGRALERKRWLLAHEQVLRPALKTA